MMRHDIYSLWQNWLQFCWNMQTHLVAPVTRIQWPDWKNVVTIPIFISHLKTLKLHFRYLIYGRKPLVWKLSSKKHQFRFHIQKKKQQRWSNIRVVRKRALSERAHIYSHRIQHSVVPFKFVVVFLANWWSHTNRSVFVRTNRSLIQCVCLILADEKYFCKWWSNRTLRMCCFFSFLLLSKHISNMCVVDWAYRMR